MPKILIYHTQPEMCLLISKLLKSHVDEIIEYMNYDRSDFISYAMHYKPDFVFLERRFTPDETGSIIYRFKYVSPKSKFFIIADDVIDCNLLKDQIVEEHEAIYNSFEIETCVKQFVHSYIKTETENSRIFKSYEEDFTKTERQIFDLILEGLTPRKVAFNLDIEYNTVRKHLQHIYQKTGIHNYKSFKK